MSGQRSLRIGDRDRGFAYLPQMGWLRSSLSSPDHYERIFCNKNTVRGGARDRSIRVVFVALLALAGGRRLRLWCVVTGNVHFLDWSVSLAELFAAIKY